MLLFGFEFRHPYHMDLWSKWRRLSAHNRADVGSYPTRSTIRWYSSVGRDHFRLYRPIRMKMRPFLDVPPISSSFARPTPRIKEKHLRRPLLPAKYRKTKLLQTRLKVCFCSSWLCFGTPIHAKSEPPYGAVGRVYSGGSAERPMLKPWILCNLFL